MSTLRKRRERWEHHNQLRLERVTELSRAQLQTQMVRICDVLSFLLYIAYGAGRWLVSLNRIFWVRPPDVDKGLLDAERQRQKLRETASFWVK